MNLIKRAFLFVFFVLLISLFNIKCANRAPVTGGVRDTIPPSRIHTNPEDQKTNIHTRVFEFIFDERIKLDNIKKELIITPRIDFEYDIKYGKRSFILEFEDDFQENTTYTFNFRNSIQDLNEGNPTKDKKFTFSTGSNIDSLHIKGYTIDLLKNDTLKDITVGLYKTPDTVNIFNGQPYYFTQSNDSGKYIIDNIKNGRYLLYAFKDNNDNLELESNAEPFAYIKDTLQLNDHIESLNLYLLQTDIRDFKLQTALPSGRNFDVNYNKYIEDFDVKPINFDEKVFSSRVKDNKSIRIYNTFEKVDSFQIEVNAVDTIGQELIDSVWVKYRPSQKPPEDFTFSLTPTSGSAISEQYEADLKFTKPVYRYTPDSILFKYDTFQLAGITKKEQVLTNKNYNNLFLRFNLSRNEVDSLKTLTDSLAIQQAKLDSLQTAEQDNSIKQSKKTVKQAMNKKPEGKGLHLYFGNNAFTSIELDSTESKVLNYNFRKSEDYATINGTVSTNYPSYIIQLLTADWKLVDETTDDDVKNNRFQFNNVAPGKYKIRVLIDENENNKWDIGNIRKSITPEPVYFYIDPSSQQSEITLRANWEITDIVLNF